MIASTVLVLSLAMMGVKSQGTLPPLDYQFNGFVTVTSPQDVAKVVNGSAFGTLGTTYPTGTMRTVYYKATGYPSLSGGWVFVPPRITVKAADMHL